MFTTYVSKHFLGEVVFTIAYLINRMPSRVLNFQTPSQIFIQTYPQPRIISSLPLNFFGYFAFVHIHQ